MADKITQKDVSASNGSVVGRDQHNIYNSPVTTMGKLCAEFMHEAQADAEYKSVIPELQHYLRGVDGEAVIGLEEKLRAANRDDQLLEAKRQKEVAAKRLHLHATSKSAQQIHILILGKLLYRFRIYAMPLIEAGKSRSKIDRAVLSKVIEPTLELLEDNVLEIYWDDAWGLIYYLTGNCHIKWAK